MWRRWRHPPRVDEELRDHRDRLIDQHLAAGMGRSEAERQAILAIEAAAASRSTDGDLLSTIGSLGAEPERDLTAAREALATGDLDRTHVAAGRAATAWAGAWEEGRRRALVGAAFLATLLVLIVAAFGTARRSRRRRRRMMAHQRLKVSQD